MPTYRLYMRDKRDLIVCREDFEAAGDDDAAAMAATVFAACSDRAISFELWQDGRQLPGSLGESLRCAAIAEARHDDVTRLEEAIWNSRWLISSSAGLIAALDARKRYSEPE